MMVCSRLMLCNLIDNDDDDDSNRHQSGFRTCNQLLKHLKEKVDDEEQASETSSIKEPAVQDCCCPETSLADNQKSRNQPQQLASLERLTTEKLLLQTTIVERQCSISGRHALEISTCCQKKQKTLCQASNKSQICGKVRGAATERRRVNKRRMKSCPRAAACWIKCKCNHVFQAEKDWH